MDDLTIQVTQIALTNRLEVSRLTSLDNILEIYKFIAPPYQILKENMGPFINSLTKADHPLKKYLENTSSPELTRDAVIRKAEDDVLSVQIDGFWIESEKNQKGRFSQNTLFLLKSTGADGYNIDVRCDYKNGNMSGYNTK